MVEEASVISVISHSVGPKLDWYLNGIS